MNIHRKFARLLRSFLRLCLAGRKRACVVCLAQKKSGFRTFDVILSISPSGELLAQVASRKIADPDGDGSASKPTAVKRRITDGRCAWSLAVRPRSQV